MNIFGEIAVILFLAVLNGVFSMSEIAIVSARKVRLQQRAEEGSASARLALELAGSPNNFLSTVQVFITLIGTLAAVVGGATIADELAAWFLKVPAVADYAHILSLGIVVIGVTITQLVIGELVPKQIGLAYPETIAAAIAGPMQFLSRMALPAVALLSRTSAGVVWLLRIRPASDPPVTEEEIKIMLEQGTQAGVFEVAEQDIVERVFRLSDRRVASLMTPRTDVVWIDIDDPIGDSMRTMINGGHTYYPACRGTIEQLVGMVSVKDQWARMVNRQPPDLKSGLLQPLYVPETMPVLKALESFKQARQHVAIVIDEYGSISGMLTLNDVLEALVGDIPTSPKPEDWSVVQRDDGSWLVDGSLSIDEFKTRVGISELPGEDEYQTLAGFLMHQLGHVPKTADHFDHDGYRFEVVDMDGHRVDKVLVVPPPVSPEDSAAGAETGSDSKN